MYSGCCIDSGDPEASEVSFSFLTVTVSIFPGLHNCLVGSDEYLGFGTAETLSVFKDLLVTFLEDVASFYSWHFAPSSLEVKVLLLFSFGDQHQPVVGEE